MDARVQGVARIDTGVSDGTDHSVQPGERGRILLRTGRQPQLGGAGPRARPLGHGRCRPRGGHHPGDGPGHDSVRSSHVRHVRVVLAQGPGRHRAGTGTAQPGTRLRGDARYGRVDQRGEEGRVLENTQQRHLEQLPAAPGFRSAGDRPDEAATRSRHPGLRQRLHRFPAHAARTDRRVSVRGQPGAPGRRPRVAHRRGEAPPARAPRSKGVSVGQRDAPIRQLDDRGRVVVTLAPRLPPLFFSIMVPPRAPRSQAKQPKDERELLVVSGREVSISNPQKVLFPKPRYTKRDLVRYYLAVAEGALRGAGNRPNVLVRYPNGITGEFFYQKRAPESRPPWIEVVTLRFPSGRTAEEVVPRDAAALVWMANLACLELHPHPVTTDDMDHPNELRVDLDPVPGIKWPQVREVARLVQATLTEVKLVGWPKTSGSRGMHIVVRIEPRWEFDDVRRAALALAREVERRAPTLATSKWWKEERHGVFIDYNQNAKDRTVAAAYSVRPTADARVSAPLAWDEVDTCDPRDFTLATMPRRFAAIGDCHAGIDAEVGSLDALLELAAAQEAVGLGDAPWPPHYKKQRDEPPRVMPSRRKRAYAADARPTADDGPSAGAGWSTDPGPSAHTDKPASGRRRSTQPLITVAKAQHKEDALAGLERW